MSSSTQSGPAQQRVPAWKRLGLQLKGPASGMTPSTPPSAAATGTTTNARHQAHVATSSRFSSATAYNKGPLHLSASKGNFNKRLRRDEPHVGQAAGRPESGRPQRLAGLTETTKAGSEHTNCAPTKAKPKAKKEKPDKKPKKQENSFDFAPTLAYLRQWQTDRGSWKFNKNHQSLLIKYVFEGDLRIPSTYIDAFHDYIGDLKGFARTRLRETAAEIIKQDMEQGPAAFPAQMKEKDARQREYDEAIGNFLKLLREEQERRGERPAEDAASKNDGKRPIDEVQCALQVASPEVKQRLLKRIRAELVVDELSDSGEESSASVETTTASATSTSMLEKEGEQEFKTTKSGMREKDDAQPPAKRRRTRKSRTEMVSSDESNSSEDSIKDDGAAVKPTARAAGAHTSTSNSSSSSSSGSSDSSSDEEMVDPDAESSESSSSSSSSSDSVGEH